MIIEIDKLRYHYFEITGKKLSLKDISSGTGVNKNIISALASVRRSESDPFREPYTSTDTGTKNLEKIVAYFVQLLHTAHNKTHYHERVHSKEEIRNRVISKLITWEM